jgi:hypothetical protein
MSTSPKYVENKEEHFNPLIVIPTLAHYNALKIAYGDARPTSCFILDDFDTTGNTLRTTRFLRSFGLSAKQITIANPDFKVQQVAYSEGINVLDGTVADYLQMYLRNPGMMVAGMPGFFVLDYCQAASTVLPDLERIFTEYLWLAITFGKHKVIGLLVTVFNYRGCIMSEGEWNTFMASLASKAPITMRVDYSCSPSLDGKMMILTFMCKLANHYSQMNGDFRKFRDSSTKAQTILLDGSVPAKVVEVGKDGQLIAQVVSSGEIIDLGQTLSCPGVKFVTKGPDVVAAITTKKRPREQQQAIITRSAQEPPHTASKETFKTYLGRTIEKEFNVEGGRKKFFKGLVTENKVRNKDGKRSVCHCYLIKYTDGDSETMSMKQVKKYLGL